MAITTRDELIDALANNSSRIVIDKASLASMVAGTTASMWRSTGQPAQGAIPGTTPVVPTSATTGAIGFTNQTSPVTSYIAWLALVGSNSATSWEFHDRVAHSGGLVLNVTTAQNISGLDLSTLAPSADRLGASDYSDVQWFLEVYTDGGATASNATINVTYDDASAGNLNVAAVGGTIRVGRRIALTPLIPSAQQGKKIRGINSVTLSASTGTAGNFGFTCTRQRTAVSLPIANYGQPFDWAALGLPGVPNDSCLEIVCACSTTSTGTLRGQGKIAHG
jgi:hypothetical protein